MGLNLNKNNIAEDSVEEQWLVGQRGVVNEASIHGRSNIPHNGVDPYPKTRLGLSPWLKRVKEICFWRRPTDYKSHPIVALEKNSLASEQYKILRERIKKQRSEKDARFIAVTSPIKSDGKTMVAVNLASTLALDYERRVLLMDGDLRSPQIHRYFGVSPSPGLSDFLMSSSNRDLNDYIRKTFLPTLSVLPAGTTSDFPSELLAKEEMLNLIDRIRACSPPYEVIVDTPPVLLTPDPLILAEQMDAIIMVVRAGNTPKEYLLKAVESLNSNKLMGVVLNGVEMGMASRHFHYPRKQT